MSEPTHHHLLDDLADGAMGAGGAAPLDADEEAVRLHGDAPYADSDDEDDEPAR